MEAVIYLYFFDKKKTSPFWGGRYMLPVHYNITFFFKKSSKKKDKKKEKKRSS